MSFWRELFGTTEKDTTASAIADLVAGVQRGDKNRMVRALESSIKCPSCRFGFLMKTGFDTNRMALVCPKCRDVIMTLDHT